MRYKIVSECDHEIPQSQTADKPMAPQGIATHKLVVRTKGKIHILHTFTCCDKVSAFHGKDIKAAWRVWNALEKATEAFQKLGNMPDPRI